MFLTLYYMAATWIQSWRLSALRSKIMLMLSRNESLVLCNEPVSVVADNEGSMSLQLSSISSHWCSNKTEARVGDLIWFNENKRGCSLFPTQRLDVTQWISFSNDKSLFPIEVSRGFQVTLQHDLTLNLLIEAEYSTIPIGEEKNCSQVRLEDYGIPRAWRADTLMGVVLETDVDNFAKLGTSFMNSRLKMDDGMELVRIESVTVEGLPCVLLNTDSIPIVRRNGAMTPDRWHTHVELLTSLSRAAEQAANDGGQVAVPGYDWAVITAGELAVTQDTPTHISLPGSSTATVEDGDTTVAGSMSSLAPGPAEGSPNSMYSLSHETVHEASTVKHQGPLNEDERSSADSFCSLDSASTMSATSHYVKQVVLSVESKTTGPVMKPPNVLVYSESAAALENVKVVLQTTLHAHKYTVYGMSQEQLLSTPWSDNARLLVVWGSVPDQLAPALVNYLLTGGQLLCLCSDLLLRVLPSFQTAEVREKEVVRFSYSRWKSVPLMHHVFCYQASPSHARFTDDKSLPVPSSVEMTDCNGVTCTLEVKVLGCEETWHTPSLLLATVRGATGRAVFSQIHLEQDPSQYEGDETKHQSLKDSDVARLDILRDLLGTHLGLECADKKSSVEYTPAYFLGMFELKQVFLGKLQDRLQNGGILKLPNMSLQLCGKGVQPAKATSSLMPVMLHSCPEHFSTVEYFENLRSTSVGRLVLYSEVMTSSMHVLEGAALHHGLAVVPVQQTRGVGRSNNVWLSPQGCAMFSLQLHIPVNTHLGQHVPLIQHICALAVVKAVRETLGYESLDLRLKWPNDIYVGSAVKIGGLVVNSSLDPTMAICNIGCGVNLNNSSPTTCINTLIEQHNATAKQKPLPVLSYERFLALTFTEIEHLVEQVQSGNVDQVIQFYYKYWLHRSPMNNRSKMSVCDFSDARITVCGPSGSNQLVSVIGIDEYGFLLVRGDDGHSFSVQPDGNTFDMLRGLISPKN